MAYRLDPETPEEQKQASIFRVLELKDENRRLRKELSELRTGVAKRWREFGGSLVERGYSHSHEGLHREVEDIATGWERSWEGEDAE